MFAPPVPAANDPLLPAYVRAAGGIRLRFGRVGAQTHRLDVGESGGYRARFPTTFDATSEAVLINTGGGMAGGDAMRVDIELGPGCDAIVTTQAAEKIYRSQGSDTRIETQLSVAAGASLAWLPQETILFSGARLARNLAVEYGPHNVRVNCIAPGLIRTDFARALWEDPEMLKRRTDTTPLRRIGEPDEIAGAAVFLASQAGSFVTGQSIVVDGGVTI